MIVATTIPDIAGAIDASCVTIGNFDGVHLGHQKLIRRTVAKAEARGLTSVVVTFEPHPLRVLMGPRTPPFITLIDQKLELIGGLGPRVALVLEFTRKMAALEPREFVERYLLDGLAMRELVVGYDYAMGKGRSGDFERLKALGDELGYGVERLDPVLLDGAVVSSTRIRHMVQAGDVWDARRLLGRFYRIQGRVIHGKDRGGRLLGFPTANLKLVDELFPKPGVYAIWCEVDGEARPGVANIGTNPTFGNDAISVEAHLLDYSGDLYDKDIRVHFVQRIRDERKFSGIDELKQRIGTDCDLGRTILASSEAQLPETGADARAADPSAHPSADGRED